MTTLTSQQIIATGFDFNQRVEDIRSGYSKGQQGRITGFDGDFAQVMAVVKWDNPAEATTAYAVALTSVRAI